MNLRTWTMVALMLTMTQACSDPAGVDAVGLNMVGQWHYAASQSSPASASLEGSLSITAQRGKNFSGTVDVIEIDQGGVSRTLSGTVQGRSLDSAKVDFELTIANVSRRHLGVLEDGPIKGAWVGRANDGQTYSGEFSARRE